MGRLHNTVLAAESCLLLHLAANSGARFCGVVTKADAACMAVFAMGSEGAKSASVELRTHVRWPLTPLGQWKRGAAADLSCKPYLGNQQLNR